MPAGASCAARPMQAVRSPRSASSPSSRSSATRSGKAAGKGETTSFAGATAFGFDACRTAKPPTATAMAIAASKASFSRLLRLRGFASSSPFAGR